MTRCSRHERVVIHPASSMEFVQVLTPRSHGDVVLRPASTACIEIRWLNQEIAEIATAGASGKRKRRLVALPHQKPLERVADGRDGAVFVIGRLVNSPFKDLSPRAQSGFVSSRSNRLWQSIPITHSPKQSTIPFLDAVILLSDLITATCISEAGQPQCNRFYLREAWLITTIRLLVQTLIGGDDAETLLMNGCMRPPNQNQTNSLLSIWLFLNSYISAGGLNSFFWPAGGCCGKAEYFKSPRLVLLLHSERRLSRASMKQSLISRQHGCLKYPDWFLLHGLSPHFQVSRYIILKNSFPSLIPDCTRDADIPCATALGDADLLFFDFLEERKLLVYAPRNDNFQKFVSSPIKNAKGRRRRANETASNPGILENEEPFECIVLGWLCCNHPSSSMFEKQFCLTNDGAWCLSSRRLTTRTSDDAVALAASTGFVKLVNKSQALTSSRIELRKSLRSQSFGQTIILHGGISASNLPIHHEYTAGRGFELALGCLHKQDADLSADLSVDLQSMI
ncbi:uncharacterized protein BDR25DRAFT_361502 [Lindgomyces ingoldianus]|uniref:Uncharacterized protein n=1 Tax=Lindgomyces ingoldianus TaxID=673940 RepID=A0ACB6QBZ5_9PLEO|nr:uncharacterized protein BDR25DRAFT_361502 [Lindgomyces ingoldianus]KAF2464431.1 hypothetical protein BDR25DRAFT_361502 [Lindgomyces ingoldianus]